MDNDGDGIVDQEDILAMEEQRRGDDFSEERAQRMFDYFDTDQDGVISKEESEKPPAGRGPTA